MRRIVSIALRSCSSLDLSTCLKGLTGQEVNILYQGIMGKQEVNIGVQGIMGTSYLFTCRPVNLSTRVVLTGQEVNIGMQGIMGISYLSTCLPGWTCPDVNILFIGIMGIPYLFICQPESRALWIFRTCPPVDLSTMVDRSRYKHIISRHYG